MAERWIPKAQEIYRHFKGEMYQVLAIAEHTETGEQLVIYQALYGGSQIYARPLEMFISPVDREKYPDAQQEFRFQLQEQEQEEPGLDPLVLEFLDANTYEERLNVLAALHHRITNEMITTMSLSCDIEVEGDDVEQRYEELKQCLLMKERFESKRLR